jgi:two-component system, NarL family, nitrate/nitrite response regulator NarL
MRATADQVRVLIVDDDELFAESLASMLTDEEEIEVVGWVSNALDAISFVASDHPDVVLMDVAMPGMNGVEAAKIIARDDPGARVVLLSGSIFGEQLEQITGETGAVAYVTKARVAIDLVPMLLAAKANRSAEPG